MIIEMHCDLWENGREISASMTNPNWDDVKNAILLLDANRRTVVRLQVYSNMNCHMIVGGTYEGRFMVNVTNNNFDFFNLVDSAFIGDPVVLFIGGQSGIFTRELFVNENIALEAAEHFSNTGGRKATLPWKSQY